MSEYNIFMTHVASDDLRSITAYIANELREPTAAKRIVAKIKEVVMSLKKMPNRYSIIDEESLAIKGIRKTIVDNYILFFIVAEENNTVTIIRILYGRRDWINLL